jgi:16S rRNA (guanine527-N7)-methyltransferase
MNIKQELEKHQDKINKYMDLLLYWQTKFNLIGNNTKEQVFTRHIIDSAQLYPYFNHQGLQIADFGSGAGFPGLVLAILNPQNHYTLIEANYKKSVFLSMVKQELSLPNVSIANTRIDALCANKEIKFDLIVSRAMSNLKTLVEYGLALVSIDGNFLFLKGANFLSEIHELGEILESNNDVYKVHIKNQHIVLIKCISSISNSNAKILSISLVK